MPGARRLAADEKSRPPWGGDVHAAGGRASRTRVVQAQGRVAAWTGRLHPAGSIFTQSLEAG